MNNIMLERVEVGDRLEMDRGHYNHWAVYVGQQRVDRWSSDKVPRLDIYFFFF